MQEFKSTSAIETRKIAEVLAKRVLEEKPKHSQAKVIALEGELGSGKTTFTQAFARALGIKEKIISPTFVIFKVYKLPATSYFLHLVHIDCYRLDNPSELEHLGLKEILKDKDAIVMIEWAGRIRWLIPKDTVWISFTHSNSPNERLINIRFTK